MMHKYCELMIILMCNNVRQDARAAESGQVARHLIDLRDYAMNTKLWCSLKFNFSATKCI
ncbi:hypothetical protein BME92_20060 [Klebsiella pneumoniae]|nr:hypothetical protein BME92_20060 [Klebsiella pneumoniae]